MDKLNNFLNAFIDKNGDNVWDEWTYYCSYDLLKESADCIVDHLNRVSIHGNDIDFVVGLSKSGLPLAAEIAMRFNLPLIPFSIGEFFSPEGDTVIGLPNIPGFKLDKKRIILLDSHIRSCETYNLFRKIVSVFQIKIVQFCVIADCRRDNNNIDNFKSVYDNDTVTRFLDNIPNKHNDPYFWKHSRDHWLIPPDNNVYSCDTVVREFPIYYLDEKLKSKIYSAFTPMPSGEKYFSPLEFYLKTDLLFESINSISNELYNLKFDTIVACSVSAIPFAIMLCNSLSIKTKNSNIRFIFLGNGDEHYFNDKFSLSNNIIFVDDVLATGGLIVNAYKRFVEPYGKSLVSVVVMVSQLAYFPFRNYLPNLHHDVKIYSLA